MCWELSQGICGKVKSNQAWHVSAVSFVENRNEVAMEKVKNEITEMFSDEFMTRGGRWDFDGFRLQMAAVSAVRGAVAAPTPMTG